jgi:uncharacterized RDD family membrane protein YckC
MKFKFEPDVDPDVGTHSVRLVDPEAYDASEQRFAASVEEKPAPARFVPDETQDQLVGSTAVDPSLHLEDRVHASGESGEVSAAGASEANCVETDEPPKTDEGGDPLQPEFPEAKENGSWRREVTDRVNNYRARRRPRVPRYPSLQLRFDPPEESRAAQEPASPAAPNRLAVALQPSASLPYEAPSIPSKVEIPPERLNLSETGAKILEFPRSTEGPPLIQDELAEPVVTRPRILDVPDILPPPPALGGILIEPGEEPAMERRPGFELPLQAAPMSKRFLAGGIDALLVCLAFSAFAYIFFRMTSTMPALPLAAGTSVSLIAVFWAAYQYLLLVYAGTTPGLQLAGLRLSRFDGAAVPRKMRRWRALASMLSGVSLALGYAWCFLDEDRLCWHDRITRTYMAPQSQG